MRRLGASIAPLNGLIEIMENSNELEIVANGMKVIRLFVREDKVSLIINQVSAASSMHMTIFFV